MRSLTGSIELETPTSRVVAGVTSRKVGAPHWPSDVVEDSVYRVEVRKENDRLRAQVPRLEENRRRFSAEGSVQGCLRSELS